MRIFVSLGHITPAISFVGACKTTDQVFLITRASNTLEASIARQLKVKAIPIAEWKLNRVKLWHTLFTFPRFIVSLIQSFQAILRYKPDRVVCFGSYISVPIGFAAYLSRVPVIIHEQTTGFSLANQLLAPIANHICLSYITSLQYIKSQKTSVTGNLIRPEFHQTSQKPPTWINNPQKKPIMYLTGGSQGSQVLNSVISQSYAQLSQFYYLVHQVGRSQIPHSLAPDSGVIKPTLTSSEVAWVMKSAELIISRAGANTVSEIMACGVPAILIPLPIAAKNEQLHNAQLLTQKGAGLILLQEKISPKTLMQAVTTIKGEYHAYKRNAVALSKLINPRSAHEVYNLVSQ